MKLAVVVNRRAGQTLGDNDRQVAARIEGLFAGAGANAAVTVAAGPDVSRAVSHSADTADAVIVAGGDGSVAAAATALLDTGRPMGVLPMGTLNFFARDLDMPMDLPAAVRALATASPRRVDAAEVNGHVFLVNSVIGLMPSLTLARESVRGLSTRQRLAEIAAVALRLAARFPTLTLEVDTGQGSTCITVRAVAVACNEYRRHQRPGTPLRRRLDEGTLAVYLATHRTRLGMLLTLGRMAIGRWRREPAVSEYLCPAATISARGRAVRVVNDGEVLRLMLPLRYRIRPLALTVLAPPQQT